MASVAANVAWLTSEEMTYFVSFSADGNRSAILELIERIYHAESLSPASRARTLLRERIHANYPATLSEREAVKVAAKRVQAPTDRPWPSGPNVIALPEALHLPRFELPGLELGMKIEKAEVPIWLDRLKNQTTRSREKWSSDRPVSAILLDENSRLLSYAWNTNAVIRTRHAERNLCESLRSATADGKIPAGATLYVSLKPCRMCAARIWEMAEDPARLSVIYLENDPGSLAQGTMLEARSPARVHYLGLDHPLFSTETSRLER